MNFWRRVYLIVYKTIGSKQMTLWKFAFSRSVSKNDDIKFLIQILSVFLNSMHKVHFGSHINEMYFGNHRLWFGESVMITFELPRGYTEAKRMTVTQKMVKLKLNIESVIRAELIILEQTYELCTRFWLGGVTSQLAQASNRATILRI